MNYLLVMPKKLYTSPHTPEGIFPLGIAYVSAALKQGGFSVYTANLDFPARDLYPALQEMIPAWNIDVVCTGGLTLDYHKIKDVIDTARKINPKVITVVGGGIISSDPETAMSILDADIGVIGEGEVTMCELAHALDNGESYDTVPGLIYRKGNDEFVMTERRKEISDLDALPMPDFDGFNYQEWVNLSGGRGDILTERSCPFHCTFCFHPTGEKYRQRSMDNIFKEIEFQVKHYNIKEIGLSGELFAITPERVLEFCDRIKKYNLPWACCLRVTGVTSSLLATMKKAGCYLIPFGLESADDSVLKSMRKGITVEQIKHALDLCYEEGMSTALCNFIFGDINETTETIENTMKVWWEYTKKTRINLNLIQVFPGTYLYEHACRNGIIKDKKQFIKDGCPIINVSKLSPTEFSELRSMVAELKIRPQVLAESVRIVETQEDETCSIEWSCRKCGTINLVKMKFWFTQACTCSSCTIQNEVDPLQAATCLPDAFFAALPEAAVIALWGAGGIYYKIMQKYPALSSDRFVLVDANQPNHGLTICGKKIQSPDILSQTNIKTVIITALSRKDDIRNTIIKNHPSVEHIFVPAFDVTEKGIVPVLRPL